MVALNPVVLPWIAQTRGALVQSSDLYITDGDSLDWLWGEHKILAFCLEMYPADGSGLDGFYPPDEVIEQETKLALDAGELALLTTYFQVFLEDGSVVVAKFYRPGRWTDAQIVTAITRGVSADGRPLAPPMAFYAYANMTPAELSDLVAYLRSLQPQP